MEKGKDRGRERDMVGSSNIMRFRGRDSSILVGKGIDIEVGSRI